MVTPRVTVKFMGLYVLGQDQPDSSSLATVKNSYRCKALAAPFVRAPVRFLAGMRPFVYGQLSGLLMVEVSAWRGKTGDTEPSY
jgi:hypothetical protein